MLQCNYHRECGRDKPDERTATCPGGKVLKLERWTHAYVFEINEINVGSDFYENVMKEKVLVA